MKALSSVVCRRVDIFVKNSVLLVNRVVSFKKYSKEQRNINFLSREIPYKCRHKNIYKIICLVEN
jgi:hypothetical protein